MKAALLVLLRAVVACSAESSDVEQACVVLSYETERFTAAPLDSLVYDVPAQAIDFRLAGNPNLSSSPFVETMWFSLADGDNIDFFRGDELGEHRLEPVPVGNATTLFVDNAGGAYVAGAIVWRLESARSP